MTNVSLQQWKADHIRATAFSPMVWPSSPEDVLRGAFGVLPEETASKPAAGEYSCVSTWNGFRIEVKKQLNRLDVVIQALPDNTNPVNFFDGIRDTLNVFIDAISKWIKCNAKEVSRLAVGLNGFLPVSSAEEGYFALKDYVRVIQVDPHRFRDFRFQVNLPQTSKVCGALTVNRLTIWSCMVIRGGFLGEINKVFGESHYCMCAIDVNTDAEANVRIEIDKVDGVFVELSEAALEILNRGIE